MKRLEIPNPKSQIPNKFQITIPKFQKEIKSILLEEPRIHSQVPKINREIINDGKKSGQYNMDEDLRLYKEENSAFVRIYGWSKPCISVGYSQNMEKEIDVEAAGKKNIEVVERPTGGGIAFHTTEDVAYSVVVPIGCLPKGLGPSYIFISQIIVEALNKIGINAEITSSQVKSKIPNPKKSSLCFSSVMPHEIVVSGKKLVGSAQKRGRHYLLQQGAISVSKLDEDLLSVVKNKDEINNMINMSIYAEDLIKNDDLFSLISKSLTNNFQNYLII